MSLPSRVTASPSWRSLPACALGLSLCSAAQAIVTSSAPANWVGTDFPQFAGVARLVIDQAENCSGTLLRGGAFVLTAAHCVTDAQGRLDADTIRLSFQGGAVGAAVSRREQITVFDGWTGQMGRNNDLALLRLDQPVAQLAGYDWFAADPMNQTVLLTGYGWSGTGATGWSSAGMGTLRYGYNQYQSTYAGAGSDYVWDFDNGRTGSSAFGGTGLGASEASIGPGDSGGGSFILRSGVMYLAGVHSFGYRDGVHDSNGVLNGSFGELAGDTVLFGARTQGWLRSVTQVPEPAAWAMLLAGLAVLGRRRR